MGGASLPVLAVFLFVGVRGTSRGGVLSAVFDTCLCRDVVYLVVDRPIGSLKRPRIR